MATENDAGRDIKVTITLVIVSLLIIICAGYFLWSWLATPPQPQSRIDLNGVSGSTLKKGDETPAYKELLETSNEQGAKAAAQNNISFIASVPLAQENTIVPVSAAKRAPAPVHTTARPSRGGQSGSNTNQASTAEKENQQLTQLLNRISPEVKAQDSATEGLQVGQVLGSSAGKGALDTGSGNFEQWGESFTGGRLLNAAAGSRGAGGPNSVVPVEIVPPYWRSPGLIDIGVDSDNSTTPVLASIRTGPYAGAQLKAPDGVRLAGDGVVIHLTEMAWRGVNYRVDAYALHDETLLANVATEVDHRYTSRIILPAILKGIGGVGQMYSEANTELVSNGFNTQTVRPGVPDGGAVAGAIAGGAAGQASKVLTDDAARVPPIQATIKPGQVVAIQFMRGVYAGDAIVPGQGGESVKPSVAMPSQATGSMNQPYSNDQWSSRAQSRIEAQRRLQENNQ